MQQQPADAHGPETNAAIGTGTSGGHRIYERLVSARKNLALQLREIETRWFENNRDPTQLGFMGPIIKAAELAATLGFPCPPVEYLTLWRPARHPLLDANARWAYLSVVRINDPAGGLTHVEIPLHAGEPRAGSKDDDDLVPLTVSPEALSSINAFLRSWHRFVDGVDLNSVSYSVKNYGGRKDSTEILAYRYQLLRELQGRGDPTHLEEAESAMRSKELMDAGAEKAFCQVQEGFGAAYRVVARFEMPELPAEQLSELDRNETDSHFNRVEMTLTEVADKWDVPKSELSKAAARERDDPRFLPSRKLGRNRLFPRDHAKKFAEDYGARREARAVRRLEGTDGN